MDTETKEFWNKKQMVAFAKEVLRQFIIAYVAGMSNENISDVPMPTPALSLPSGAGAEDFIHTQLDVPKSLVKQFGFETSNGSVNLLDFLNRYASLVALQKSEEVIKRLNKDWGDDKDGEYAKLYEQHQGKEKTVGAEEIFKEFRKKRFVHHDKWRDSEIIGIIEYALSCSTPPLAEKKGEAVDELAERGIVCWMVPVSYSDMVQWGYEMEVLPYTELGRFAIQKHGSNILHSYKQWPTYGEAKREMIASATELYDLSLTSNAGKEGDND